MMLTVIHEFESIHEIVNIIYRFFKIGLDVTPASIVVAAFSGGELWLKNS